jgi:hypothetical protein
MILRSAADVFSKAAAPHGNSLICLNVGPTEEHSCPFDASLEKNWASFLNARREDEKSHAFRCYSSCIVERDSRGWPGQYGQWASAFAPVHELATKLAREPRSRELPVAQDGLARDLQDVRCFLDGQSAEESELYDLCPSRIHVS